MPDILEEAHSIMAGQTETIEILSEMVSLYKQIDAQQERTIKAQDETIKMLYQIIGRLEAKIDRLEAQ